MRSVHELCYMTLDYGATFRVYQEASINQGGCLIVLEKLLRVYWQDMH